MKLEAGMAGLMLCCCVTGHLQSAEAPWRVAETPWPASLGNHRAVVHVEKPADAVLAHIPWRRHDNAPEKKAVFVTEAGSTNVLANSLVLRLDRESGDVVFQAPGAGDYCIYYMPFTLKGPWWLPGTDYDKLRCRADQEWLRKNELKAGLEGGKAKSLPEAKLLRFEARTEFDSFYPMEIVATAEETTQFKAKHPAPYLLFPENRRDPIRMTEDLPEKWIRGGPGDMLKDDVEQNEFYVFQIGVYAAGADLERVSVSFSDLRSGGGEVIPASALRCFNLGGIDWKGRPFAKQVGVAKGRIQAFWCGVDVAAETKPGVYEGAVTVKPEGQAPATVKLVLNVLPQVLKDRGDSELWRMSRLRWLDSTIGLEEEVTAPYTPLKVKGRSVSCLGREVVFGNLGLPDRIKCGESDILSGPAGFHVQTAEGPVNWKAGEVKVVSRNKARVTLVSQAAGDGFSLGSHVEMEFDGYINVQLTLKAEREMDIADCALEIPMKKAFAEYMMGLGCKGGYRPERWDWKWDQNKHEKSVKKKSQDSVWLGTVKGGLQCKLKGPDYRWPLVNFHDKYRPLLMPEAWHNEGKGGCRIEAGSGESVIFRAFGGPRKMAAGQVLRFDFGLLVTPVKPLDVKAHWQQRYYHSWRGVAEPAKIAESGATIVNIHQGRNELNPFINYPFLTADKMAGYAKKAHEAGLKMKIYYTIRELSNHAAELWALRSLGNEIYAEIHAEGRGGWLGYAWLHEHLDDRFASAWHEDLGYTHDASLSQTGLSRWHNYYLEGLNWLCANVGIDGLYLDEIGYDREIMKRVRRVLDRARPGSLLDLHSSTPPDENYAASCLNLYMEHMPYLDSVWIGEGRNYNESPDYYLVEISGVPFGLMGEMLQGGGNPWRGMLYGMTTRLAWSGNPKPIWKVWDEFGIGDSRMLGYWDEQCPVKTGNKDVLATAYVKQGKTLISLASWAKDPTTVNLSIDWKALRLDPAKATLRAPAVDRFQEEKTWKPTDGISVEPGKGWLLIVRDSLEK